MLYSSRYCKDLQPVGIVHEESGTHCKLKTSPHFLPWSVAAFFKKPHCWSPRCQLRRGLFATREGRGVRSGVGIRLLPSSRGQQKPTNGNTWLILTWAAGKLRISRWNSPALPFWATQPIHLLWSIFWEKIKYYFQKIFPLEQVGRQFWLHYCFVHNYHNINAWNSRN